MFRNAGHPKGMGSQDIRYATGGRGSKILFFLCIITIWMGSYWLIGRALHDSWTSSPGV